MQRWTYLVGGVVALAICAVTGYFVVEHLLWVRTFGLPILSEWGLPAFIAAFSLGLSAIGLITWKLIGSSPTKGS